MIVGVSSRAIPRSTCEEHLDELERLVESAGGEVVGRIVKERAAPDPATFVGRGAAEEVGALARDERARLVVFDDELTPAQVRNLEERWSAHGFVRVHRQYVANLHRAVELRPQLRGTAELVFGDGQTIPIARRQVNELSRRLGV